MTVTVWDVQAADVSTGPPALTVWDLVADGAHPAAVPAALTTWGTTTDGPPSVVVVPPPTVQAEPGTTVQLTASLLGGGTADSWAWRVLSGPPVALTGTGPTRSLVGPSVWPPAQALVLGIRATVGAVTSPEQTCTVVCLPRLLWARSGPNLVPAPLSVRP